MWVPGSYDPETHLYIVGTGNPTPAYTSQTRGEGDNLFTCSLVAINVDTGKMAWYYQTSPHDTHDWDSAQTPVLVDGDVNGQAAQDGAHGEPQRLLLHARSRDRRAPGDRQVLRNRELGEGHERRGPAGARSREGPPRRRRAGVAGQRGATNWPPPAYSPDTGLFYVPSDDTYAMYYLTETDPRGAMGLGGKEERSVGTVGSYLIGDRLQDRQDRVAAQVPHASRTAAAARDC